jgi:DNA-binding response OmpR family regulator
MLTVLIAEDDVIIGRLVEDVLVAEGYVVCGIARTVAEAVALGLSHKPDLAVIDLMLADGGLGTEIPSRLNSLPTLGVLYVTSDVAQLKKVAVSGHAALAKVYRPDDLLRSLEIVISVVGGEVAHPPFPPGLCLLPSANAGHGPEIG